MSGPAAAPKKCPECTHTQEELDRSRALVTLLDTGNEEAYEELEQLKAENERVRDILKRMTERFQARTDKAIRECIQADKRAEAWEAIKDWCRHSPACNIQYQHMGVCDCGLSAKLKANSELGEVE